MKWFLDKSFILTLIVLAAVAALIGMVSGPFGYEEVSIGASMSACLICLLIITFGLINWKKRR